MQEVPSKLHMQIPYTIYTDIQRISEASFGPIWYVGADIVSFSQAKDVTNTVDGIQFVGGIGVGLDVHVADSYTRSLNNLKQAKKKPPKRNSSINNTNRLPSSRTMFTMLLQ